MKERLESPREFNPPAEMLARASFLFTLTALALGVLLTIAGVVTWQPSWSLVGLGVLALGCAGKTWLQRHGDFDAHERSFARIWQHSPAPDEARAAELLGLLEAWEALEEKRGSADFDPWALQDVRNRIGAVVKSDPALEELFARLRQVA